MAYDEVQHLSLPEISDHTNQPSSNNFPKRLFGKTKIVHRMHFSNRGLVNGNDFISVHVWEIRLSIGSYHMISV